MDDFNLEENPEVKSDSSSNSKIRRGSYSYLFGILLFFIWAGMSVYGFYYAQNYFEQYMKKIEETNALNIQSINKRIDVLEEEMKNINGTLDKTGSSLNSTTSASTEVNKRITELDNQLKALEKSLKILQESGNEDY